jgi:NAD(P)H dehydrogenase (quinone)
MPLVSVIKGFGAAGFALRKSHSAPVRNSNKAEDTMPGHTSRALITGATGQIGRAVLKQLREDASVEAIVAARSPEKAAGLGFPVVAFDYDRSETIAPALEGIDSVFVVTGYTVDMLRQSKTLVDHANVRREIHSPSRCLRR